MIIGIGETVLDIIFKNDQPMAAIPGGSTFNAIISIGRMGVPCTMVTETGSDHVGDITVDYMRDNGVDTRFVTRHEGTKSHVSLAFLDDNNDAQYQFYKDHPHASISERIPVVTKDDIVIFGSFFAINPVIRPQVYRLLRSARDAGATIYYDINFRPSHIGDIPDTIGNIVENMRLSTVVRGSLEDFGYLYGLHDVDEIYERHVRDHCPCFICTDGGNPIELRTPSVRASFAARRIDTASTVGAGDNFNAGFSYAVYNDGSIGHKDFATLPLETWHKLIASGQAFSSEVCSSIYNSVPKGFTL